MEFKSFLSRSMKEQIIDKLLILFILNKYKFNGKTKLHKAVFFAEDSANKKKMKIFNFNFFRYNFGEYSNELQTDYRDLVDKGFLLDTRTIQVSSEGKELLKRCETIFDKNVFLLNNICPIIEHIASCSLDKVKEMAYTKVIVSGKQVKDLEIGTPILNKLEENESERKMFIDDKWVEKIKNIMDCGFFKMNEDMIRECKQIHEIMLPKRIRLLMKLDEYEKISKTR